MTLDMPSNPLIIIHERYDQLSAAERRVADYVLEHAAEVAPAPIAETALNAGVSEATVVRFCRSLGYRGYLEFKFGLAYNLNDPVRTVHDEIRQEDSISEIAHKTIVSGITALQHTLDTLDMRALAEVVKAIDGARQTLLIGVGTSTPFVEDLYNKLLRQGLNCAQATDPYLQMTNVALIGAGDVVVALTHSGASADPVNALRRSRERGARTIAITGSGFSPITRHADVVLLYSARETRLEAVIARLAMLAMCDVLTMALAMRHLDRTNLNERRIWELMLDKVVDA